MILYGASGHAKVIIDCLKANQEEVIAVFDDNESISTISGIEVIGKYNAEYSSKEPLIISIGDNQIRKKISEKLSHRIGKVIHPTCQLGAGVQVDEGSVLFHGAIVQANTKIGKHVIVNTAASIDHDGVIEDYAHISPNATLCGAVSVGEGTHIGAGATLIQGVKVGKWSVVGAGAVVIEDVPDYCLVVGNPAKIDKLFDHV